MSSKTGSGINILCDGARAVSSDDALVDYSEPTRLTVLTPLISFLVVLVSFLTLLAVVAFFTDHTAIGHASPLHDIASVNPL